MKQIYGEDWDVATEFEKKNAIKQEMSDRKLGKIHAIVKQSKNEDAWAKKVDNFVEQAEILEQFQSVVENKEKFIKFAMQPTHRGVPLETLAKSFSFDNPKGTPTPTPTSDLPIIEIGGGSEPPVNPPSKMTPEQIAELKKKDYKKYMELVRTGAIVKELSE